jgi:cystathionine beta-lyase
MRKHKIDTLLATIGRDPVVGIDVVNPPVVRGSTILFATLDELESARNEYGRPRYGRHGTPTTVALQQAISELEGAEITLVLPSGMAAIAVAMLAFVEAGDQILVADCVYEPTRIHCQGFLNRFGVETVYFDPALGADIAALITPRTRAIMIESPGSLTFDVMDAPAIVAAARAKGVRTICDNTWATPFYFKPLALGVDVSVMSATKYIGAHSDLLLGTVSANRECYEPIRRVFTALGQHASPDDCWLALRGLRTLGVRLPRHQENGLRLAQWLAGRPEVERVLHPALPGHPGHAIWKRDFTGATGLFSFVMKPTPRAALAAFVDGLALFGMGYSWGGYESLCLPSHPERCRTAKPWVATGPLLRIHAGLEDADDLIADLDAAFVRRNAALGARE